MRALVSTAGALCAKARAGSAALVASAAPAAPARRSKDRRVIGLGRINAIAPLGARPA
jgi:hypothetical protein